MSLHRLVYASRPFGYASSDLMSILIVARANNARDGITGALICRDDLFLQYLEGEAAEVARCFRRIRQDDRHVEVTELVSEAAAERLFPHWAMRHDPQQSWVWSRGEIASGILESVSHDEVLGVFRRLAASPAGTD